MFSYAQYVVLLANDMEVQVCPILPDQLPRCDPKGACCWWLYCHIGGHKLRALALKYGWLLLNVDLPWLFGVDHVVDHGCFWLTMFNNVVDHGLLYLIGDDHVWLCHVVISSSTTWIFHGLTLGAFVSTTWHSIWLTVGALCFDQLVAFDQFVIFQCDFNQGFCHISKC